MLGPDQLPDPRVGKAPAFRRAYDATSTENVTRGMTEVWEVVNTTADTHPMHFHLANVQVLPRQALALKAYSGGVPTYLGPLVAPDLNELGWKETVCMNPRELTRVIMKHPTPETIRVAHY